MDAVLETGQPGQRAVMLGYISEKGKQGVQPIEVRKSRLNKDLLLRLRDAFLAKGCRCGSTVDLECHHVRGDKKYNIGELIFVNCVPEILLEELKKCEPICRKCHDMRHPVERFNSVWLQVEQCQTMR